MEYAISVAVVLIFVVAYALKNRDVKPLYFEYLPFDAFKSGADALVKSMPLPKETSKPNTAKYVSFVKRSAKKLKRARYNGAFDAFIGDKDKLKLSITLPTLVDLPSIDGEPRAVLLARFCLAHSGFELVPDRVACVLEAQNRWRTLSFKEIEALKDSFMYVLIEQLAGIFARLKALAQCLDIADSYVKYPYIATKKLKSLTKSKLFLSLCAMAAGYKAEPFQATYDACVKNLKEEFDAVMRSMERVSGYDFTPYYTPLEIFDKYEIFDSASPSAKRNFLLLLSEISDRENIDEFMLAVRVDKYMHSASSGHMRLRRLRVASRLICLINHKRDISMIGTALSSHYFMDLYFAPTGIEQSRRSITKIIEYENSFEPIYKFRTVNFGISTKDGRLRLTPKLPDEVESADIEFANMGVKHTLHLKRGRERELYLGETRLMGTDEIRLNGKPLDITLVLPRDGGQ